LIKSLTQSFVVFILASFLSLACPAVSGAQQNPPASNPAPSDAQPSPQSAPQSDSSAKPAAPGQDAAPAPSPQSPADKSAPDKATADKSAADADKGKATQSTSAPAKGAGTSNDRLFLALPNFLTLEGSSNVPPLTSGQKFKVVARGAFDKVQIPWYLTLAAISQAENSEPGYGQGWEGYGKRFASAFADGAIENFLTSAVFPSLLRQDPRFFQSSQGGFGRRAGYAVSRIFVTRTDSGHAQFNYSEIFGSALAATISTNTYHPKAFITSRYDPTTNMVVYVHNASSRTLSNTASVWGTQVGYDSITYVIKEFWPDVRRKIVKQHNKAVTVPPASTNP